VSIGPARDADEENQSKITGAVVDFLEDHGVTTYAVKRSPSSIILSLPNEPEVAVQRHLEGLKDRLQEIVFTFPERVTRDPRDHHAIVIEVASATDPAKARDALVRALRGEESELRHRGIESLLLFGSAATLKSYPNDIDLLVRFRPGLRLSAFDLAEIQAYLEQTLGRRVDLSTEASFPTEFRKTAEQSGIRIFGT
jgi:predicted nucleotidyltransferase